MDKKQKHLEMILRIVDRLSNQLVATPTILLEIASAIH
jgi:hypothetical protein